jgi:carbamoyl-phosphate synthase large subunit
MTALQGGGFTYIISTSRKGRDPAEDSVKIRRKAVSLGIPCLTSIDTANALADSLLSNYSEINTELVNINDMRKDRVIMKFTKMQGAGNDYIYIDCFEYEINSPESLSPALSDRHYGIGGDGVVLISPSDIADAKMRMFNLDGSEGKMCGNAIRCVAKYLYEKKGLKKRNMKIETLSGVKELYLNLTNGEVSSVKVNMGKADLTACSVPVISDKEVVIDAPIQICGQEYKMTCVSMGNPHAVVFCDYTDNLDLMKIGPLFEKNPVFPEGVNTEFVRVVDENTLKMRVWERGSGETLACGTGACAAAVAAVINGYCKKDTPIKVVLKGGDLIIQYTDDAVYMTGDCVTVFEGQVRL